VLSHGEGISLIVEVDGADAAHQAEQAGATALVLTGGVDARLVREATALPLVVFERDANEHASGCIVQPDVANLDFRDDLEIIFSVETDEQLEEVLERHDPEILLLRGPRDEAETVSRVLELLADVPAGKLAIAAVWEPRPDELAQLERAGVDAVLAGDLNHFHA
jgi:hypothetical protein